MRRLLTLSVEPVAFGSIWVAITIEDVVLFSARPDIQVHPRAATCDAGRFALRRAVPTPPGLHDRCGSSVRCTTVIVLCEREGTRRARGERATDDHRCGRPSTGLHYPMDG